MSDGKKIYRRFFSSPQEFFDSVSPGTTLAPGDIDKYPQAYDTLCTTEGGDKFHGKASSVAKAWAAHRFSAGASLLDGIIGSLKSAEFSVDRWQFCRRLEEGDEVDCDRWLNGSDRCWSGVRRRRQEKRVVRLFLQVGGHCGRSKDELAVSGAVAVSLVEMLEASGVAVELWATGLFVEVFRGGSHDGLLGILLKGSDGFADLGMINFVCGDNRVFRNSFFRAICLLGAASGHDVFSSLGLQRNLTREHIGMEDGEAEETVVIPAMYDVNEAKKWLAEFIKNNGKTKEDK